MNNLEWLRTLGAMDLAIEFAKPSCDKCASKRDCEFDDCPDGIAEWMGLEHGEPDSLERLLADVRRGGAEVAYKACAYFGVDHGVLCRECPRYASGCDVCDQVGAVLGDIARRLEGLMGCDGGYRFSFPRCNAADGTALHDQCMHIKSEVRETWRECVNARWQDAAVECLDAIHAAETLLRMLEERFGVDLDAAHREVIEKNRGRGYYDAR